MAIIDNKPHLTCEELETYYFKKYGTTRPYLLQNQSYVSEVAQLCCKKFHSKRG